MKLLMCHKRLLCGELLRKWVACIAGGMVLFHVSHVHAEPLWRNLMAKPEATVPANGDISLTENHGPWFVMAATFSGEGAESQARDLAVELRREHSLKAYLHTQTFDLTTKAPVQGFDRFGTPVRSSLRLGSSRTEIAVLVGDFASVNDASAQKVLKKIKSLRVKSLSPEHRDSTSQSLASLRIMQRAVRNQSGTSNDRGPMGHAFITRNPLLPEEYFAPKGVEPFVAQMNRGVEYSLLDCPARYTIKVATFRGRRVLQGNGEKDVSFGVSKGEHPLILAAKNAHNMTVALREKGWEAYEFHGRTESYVAVGSFDEVLTSGPGGMQAPSREVSIIIRTFGAMQPTQFSKPNDIANARLRESAKKRAQRKMAQSIQLADGFHPKQLAGLPFDIHPEVIQAPKRTISSDYLRR